MQKHSILDVWRGSEYASAEKQGKCKLFKKNIHCHYVLNYVWYVYFNDIS